MLMYTSLMLRIVENIIRYTTITVLKKLRVLCLFCRLMVTFALPVAISKLTAFLTSNHHGKSCRKNKQKDARIKQLILCLHWHDMKMPAIFNISHKDSGAKIISDGL